MTRTTPEIRARPRKLPRQARSLQTVEAIVEGAARILEEHGHAAFSTNAVAERAGVSVGSLYQYFPSKDALIGALVLRETARLIADSELAASRPTATAALEGFISACIAHQFRRPRLARLLDFEEARVPSDADTVRILETIHAIVQGMVVRPGIPPQPDAAVAARDVVAIVKSLVDSAGQRGETGDRMLAARITRAVFGYLSLSTDRAGSAATGGSPDG